MSNPIKNALEISDTFIDFILILLSEAARHKTQPKDVVYTQRGSYSLSICRRCSDWHSCPSRIDCRYFFESSPLK
jgi:hypothetical protein